MLRVESTSVMSRAPPVFLLDVFYKALYKSRNFVERRSGPFTFLFNATLLDLVLLGANLGDMVDLYLP